MRGWFVSGAMLMLLQGCAHDYAEILVEENMHYEAVAPEPQYHIPMSPGSLYACRQSVNLYEQVRNYKVGDIISVALQEATQASSQSTTALAKDSSVDAATAPTILGQIPSMKLPGNPSGARADLSVNYDQKRAFDSKSTENQSNTLSGTISVTVAQVLPNGNLVIQGQKWLTLNNTREFIRLRGIVRPSDISADNLIASHKIVDAKIAYSTKGVVQQTHKPGWIWRFFNTPLWPL